MSATSKSRFKFDWLKQLTTAEKTTANRDGMPLAVFHTLVALWNYADHDSRARPGIKALSKDCGCSERTVERHLRWAREHGWIRQAWRGRGTYASIYALELPPSNPTSKVSSKAVETEKSNTTRLRETPASMPTPWVSPQQRELDRGPSLTSDHHQSDVIEASGGGDDSKVEDRPVDECAGFGSLRSRRSNLQDDASLVSTREAVPRGFAPTDFAEPVIVLTVESVRRDLALFAPPAGVTTPENP